MTPEDILEKGAEALAEHGHVKGTYGMPGYGFCALGSMRHVTHGSSLIPLHSPDYNAYQEAVQRLEDEVEADGWERREGWDLIPGFNDDPRTTLEDVRLMMKRAAGR